jgi:hypothetical protein
MRFNAQRDMWSGRIALFAAAFNGKRLSVATAVHFEDRPEGECPLPFWTLAPEEAQELANALWAAGIMPAQGAGSAGQLGAVQYHLEDMRKLVFAGGRHDG